MEREVEAVRKGSVGVVGGVCVVPGGETGLRTSCGRGTNCAFHLGFLAVTVILVPWLAHPSPRKRSGLIAVCPCMANELRRVSPPASLPPLQPPPVPHLALTATWSIGSRNRGDYATAAPLVPADPVTPARRRPRRPRRSSWADALFTRMNHKPTTHTHTTTATHNFGWNVDTCMLYLSAWCC